MWKFSKQSTVRNKGVIIIMLIIVFFFAWLIKGSGVIWKNNNDYERYKKNGLKKWKSGNKSIV